MLCAHSDLSFTGLIANYLRMSQIPPIQTFYRLEKNYSEDNPGSAGIGSMNFVSGFSGLFGSAASEKALKITGFAVPVDQFNVDADEKCVEDCIHWIAGAGGKMSPYRADITAPAPRVVEDGGGGCGP